MSLVPREKLPIGALEFSIWCPIMTVLRAITHKGADPYQYEPYPFRPVPVVAGPALDADVDLLLSLTARTYLVPTFLLWLFMGPEGEGLFLRRAATKELRSEFEAEFARRHPALVAREAVARAVLSAVTVIRGKPATMPELIFSETVRAVLPPAVHQAAQVPLPIPGCAPNGNSVRCDHQVRYGDGRPGPVIWVEIAGMLDIEGNPLTQRGVEYVAGQGRRASYYETAGLPPALTVTAGTLCDPVARRVAISRMLEPFIGASGKAELG